MALAHLARVRARVRVLGLGLGLGYDGLCRVPLAHVARRFVEQAERVVDLVRVRVGLGWQ